SQNQGTDWEQLNIGLADQLTTAVALDFQDNIYVGTSEGGVFQKTNSQSSFTLINMHQGMSNVLNIYVTQDNSLYICSELGGLFKRNEFSLEWEQLNAGLPLTQAIPLGFDSDDNFYLGNSYSGFYRSTDTGDSWFPIAPYFGGSHRFTFLEYNNQLFFGTTIEFAFFGMLFRSTDQGESWDYFHEGIPLILPGNPWIQVVMGMDVNSDGDLFAALNTSGIYRRLVTDDSWHYVNSNIPDTDAFSVCVNSNDIVFAGFPDGYIYKSSDNGEKWVQSLSGYQGYTVEFLKSAGNYVFAILHNWNYPHQDSSIGLYSYDNGDNWFNLNVSGLGSRVNSIDYFSDDFIIAGTDTNGVFVSTDFGNNWTGANSGLSDNNIKGVIIHPDGLLLCGTENGGIFIADLIPTNVDNINNSLVNFSLQQNYPNPFNPGTIITWQLAVSSDVTIKVYDVLGNEVATLVNEEKPAGKYEVKFNGSGLSSGLYFYQLKAGSFIQTKKMLLLK
ncbi:MAG: T9SS type A sorting domain-containing protein, partial [Ignavibacteriaceae bacterium]|nr:T9SS type A sorting domain-containing protein [Ignavibacteriaceae bacterium]